MLKVLFALLFLNLHFISAPVKNAINYHETFRDAKKAALGSGKPIFVIMHMDHCRPCDYMEHEVLNKKAVVEFFNSNYECVKLMNNDFNGKAFAFKYDIWAYPTIMIFDHLGEHLITAEGAKKKEELLEMAAKYCENSR